MMNDKTYYLRNNPTLYIETLKEFSTKPYDIASLNTIISNSGFNKGSFYYRFNDKFDLYIAIFSEIIAKQFDYIDLLKNVTVNDGFLKSYISTLFESQLELYNENPNYLNFLELYSKESNKFKNKVISISGSPIIDIFSVNILNFFENHSIISDQNNISIFLNQIKYSYYNLIPILDNTINKINLNGLVDNLIFGIYKNNAFSQREPSILAKNLNFLYTKTDKGIFNVDFTLNKSEILAIVGPKNSGKSTLSNVLLGKLNVNSGSIESYNFSRENSILDKQDQIPYRLFVINKNRSIQWNIKKITKDFSIVFENASLLNDFDIDIDSRTKIKNFELKKQIIFELYIKTNLHKELIIVDDLLKDLIQPEIQLLSNYLLKCKSQGSTIILTSEHIYNVIGFTDKIAFLSDGHLIKIKTVDELHQKYGKITHIVKYIDGNNTKIAAFSNENFNSEFFKSIIDQYKLLSLETKTILPDEIFKLETGVNL